MAPGETVGNGGKFLIFPLILNFSLVNFLTHARPPIFYGANRFSMVYKVF